MQIDRNRQADAWLAETQRSQQGRLTLFLGAAPGVGKTYAMLSRAHELMQQGVDVVVGWVDTHGRPQTAELLAGLNLISRKQVIYQQRQLEEMDLDQLLARAPHIVLVDELAHRNAPHSRHAYRWQDVNELLDAGIDVYSTLNIQHLESLNDVVYQMTAIRVTETVPDGLFKRLKDIRLIDLPVPELLERLKQGKIYPPAHSTAALEGFFQARNLSALRDLAIQTVADQLEDRYRDTPTRQGQMTAVQHHLMLVIDGGADSEDLVRRAQRSAERRHAQWSVIAVQKQRLPPQTSLQLTKAFALAQRLGAETYLFHNDQVAATILQAAYDCGASNILLGHSSRTGLWPFSPRQRLSAQLLALKHPFEITLVQPNSTAAHTSSSVPQSSQGATAPFRPREILDSLLIMGAGLLLAMLGDHYLGYTDLALIFIITVMLIAIRAQMLITSLSVFACFVLYNYFFISPRYTLQISAQSGVITIFLFLACGLLVGRLANRLKAQVIHLKSANSTAMQLQQFDRKLSHCVDLDQVLHTAKYHLQSVLSAQLWLRVGSHCSSAHAQLSPKDQIAADWCQKHLQPCGRFSQSLNQSIWCFYPLQLQQDNGVVGIAFAPHKTQLSFAEQRLIELLLDALAQTTARVQLASQLENARVLGETERLRSALLSSVSHDLRSPLAAMIGSADSLKLFSDQMSRCDRDALLDTIHIEGERLDRYIQNLLDMTRLGHQGLTLVRSWISIEMLIQSAATRLQRYQPAVLIEQHITAGLPELYVHPALIEQAIFNVLENAAKFSPPDQPLQIQAQLAQQWLQIDVIDAGVGIPEAEREQIFSMFYSMQRGDRGKNGTGMGLAIVKAIIGAHQGQIQALSAFQHYGTLVRIQLPIHPHDD
jgi:two-component system sensor histidine kinase KdpD